MNLGFTCIISQYSVSGNLLYMIFLSLQVYKEWESGCFEIKDGDEDIHTANERRLKVRRYY